MNFKWKSVNLVGKMLRKLKAKITFFLRSCVQKANESECGPNENCRLFPPFPTRSSLGLTYVRKL